MGDTPVPIPNTMVKTQAADGTALATVWESRWLPEHLMRPSRRRRSSLVRGVQGHLARASRQAKTELSGNCLPGYDHWFYQ